MHSRRFVFAPPALVTHKSTGVIGARGSRPHRPATTTTSRLSPRTLVVKGVGDDEVARLERTCRRLFS